MQVQKQRIECVGGKAFSLEGVIVDKPGHCWFFLSLLLNTFLRDIAHDYDTHDMHLLQGVVTEASPQSVPPSSQDASGQQQPLCVDGSSDHAPTYSYQPAK